VDRLQAGYASLGVEERLAKVAGVEMDVAVIRATMATRDDFVQMGRLLTTLILPIYGVLIIILIFLYNAKA
jgi:hypothetical protein